MNLAEGLRNEDWKFDERDQIQHSLSICVKHFNPYALLILFEIGSAYTSGTLPSAQYVYKDVIHK
jgi:hypothetical protein